jgi:hypothetical protein
MFQVCDRGEFNLGAHLTDFVFMRISQNGSSVNTGRFDRAPTYADLRR